MRCTKADRIGNLRCFHALHPACGPAIAAAQAAHHAGLRKLLPLHALDAAPAVHRNIARIAPGRASFFVAEEMGHAPLATQGLQYLHCLTNAQKQRQAALLQSDLQGGEGTQQEIHMTRIAFKTLQPCRLDDEDRKRALTPRRLHQRRVIAQAQVALEPDQADAHVSLGPGGVRAVPPAVARPDARAGSRDSCAPSATACRADAPAGPASAIPARWPTTSRRLRHR